MVEDGLRCLANSAQIRQSRPDSGHVLFFFTQSVLKSCKLFASRSAAALEGQHMVAFPAVIPNKLVFFPGASVLTFLTPIPNPASLWPPKDLEKSLKITVLVPNTLTLTVFGLSGQPLCTRLSTLSVQGYLAHKKPPHHRTLQ